MKDEKVQLQRYFKSKSMDNRSSPRSSSRNPKNVKKIFNQKKNEIKQIHFPLIKQLSIKSETLKHNKRKVEAPSKSQVSTEQQKLLEQIEMRKEEDILLQKQWIQASQQMAQAEQRQNKARQVNDWEQIVFEQDIIKDSMQYISKIFDRRTFLEGQIRELKTELDALKKK